MHLLSPVCSSFICSLVSCFLTFFFSFSLHPIIFLRFASRNEISHDAFIQSISSYALYKIMMCSLYLWCVTEAKLAEHDANVRSEPFHVSRRLSFVQCKCFIMLCTHEIIFKSNKVNSKRNMYMSKNGKLSKSISEFGFV